MIPGESGTEALQQSTTRPLEDDLFKPNQTDRPRLDSTSESMAYDANLMRSRPGRPRGSVPPSTDHQQTPEYPPLNCAVPVPWAFALSLSAASQQTRNEALATAPPSAASATLPPSISFSGGQTFLMHKGEDCWKDCGKSGPCSWCGTGKCCRQGYNGGENGCAVDEGGQDKHVCICM